MSEFFKYGHSYEYINNMSYWDFIDINKGFAEQQKNLPKYSNEVSHGKPSRSQQLMIQQRIKQREKEGIKSG
jgi:hypothetical protein